MPATRRKGVEYLSGQMVPGMRGSSPTMPLVAQVHTLGATVAFTLVNGATTECTEQEITRGQTAGRMLANTLRIRSKARARFRGQMDACSMGNGYRASSTGRADSSPEKAAPEKEFGQMANVCAGPQRLCQRQHLT